MSAAIYSRPKYARLVPDLSASRHLLVAEGDGICAVSELLSGAPKGFAARATILYLPASEQRLEVETSLATPSVQQFASRAELLHALRETLETSAMGMRLYAAGGEEWIGQVKSIAYEFGMSDGAIYAEHRGSRTRRVQCVHCKQILEGVASNLVPCVRCGAVLYVRDHYSRRLAAFMGVAANAEDPGAPLPDAEAFS